MHDLSATLHLRRQDHGQRTAATARLQFDMLGQECHILRAMPNLSETTKSVEGRWLFWTDINPLPHQNEWT